MSASICFSGAISPAVLLSSDSLSFVLPFTSCLMVPSFRPVHYLPSLLPGPDRMPRSMPELSQRCPHSTRSHHSHRWPHPLVHPAALEPPPLEDSTWAFQDVHSSH